ncbi:hypothetical protein ACWEKT_19370 [Nocardia takedensis]
MNIRDRFARYLTDYEPHPALDGVEDEPASTYLRRATLDGFKRFDPNAYLPGFAGFRLYGGRFEEGLFDAHAAEIYGRLDREIRAAVAPEVAAELEFGFRSIQQGSVVLPLEPFTAAVADQDQLPGALPSPLEAALIRVSDVHDAVEAGPDGPNGMSAELAKQLRLLIESLDHADANLEIMLSRTDGSERRSHLTRRGRANGRTMFGRKIETNTEIVAGVLAAVEVRDELAKIEVRVGKRKTILIERVPADVAKRGIEWDVPLRILVRTEHGSDRFDAQKNVVRQFIRLVGHEEPLPLGIGGEVASDPPESDPDPA